MNYYRIEGSHERNKPCFEITLAAYTKHDAIERFKTCYSCWNGWKKPTKVKILSVETK
jgi:hypothetical protein